MYGATSGYVPRGLNIGGGDNIEIEVCLECGQLQGEWPVPDPQVKSDDELDEDTEENEEYDDRCIICQNEGAHDVDDRDHVFEGQE